MRDVGEARVLLGNREADGPVTARVPGAGSRVVVAAFLVVLGLAVGAFAMRHVSGTAEEAPTRILDLVLDPPPNHYAVPAISPSGRYVAYRSNVDSAILVRDLEIGTTTRLAGSEDAIVPVFSPDSRSVAFFAGGWVKVGALGGGLPVPVTPIAGGINGAVWVDDETIVLAGVGSRVPKRVSLDGKAEDVPVRLEGEGASELRVLGPCATPDPDVLLVTVRGPQTGGDWIATLSLGDGTVAKLTRGSSPRFVAPSTVVFVQRDALVAAAFDPGTLTLTGPEVPLAPALGPLVADVVTRMSSSAFLDSITREGRALFPIDAEEPHQLVWVGRAGAETPFDSGRALDDLRTGPRGENWGAVDLDRDEELAAFANGSVLLVLRVDEPGDPTVLPAPGATTYPRWDPRGGRLAVIGNATGAFQGYLVEASGNAPPAQFTSAPQSVTTSFAPDGDHVLGYVVTAERGRDLWLFGADGEHRPLLETPANERAPAFSPDGRAFVYVSDESGQDQIYLRLFPDSDRVWPVSTLPGISPRWSRDGSEIYFISGNEMVAVPADLLGGVRLGAPETLFSVSDYAHEPYGNALYDVTKDGRFLMVREGSGSRAWRWIEGWGNELADALR